MTEKPADVYLFGTCLVDLFWPEAGVAAVELLEREGVRVIFPRGQSCCGQPAFNSGHPDEALAVARAQLACFPRDIPVVVPSGSCAGMIRRHWPELFAGQPDEARAVAIAERTIELTQFLVNVLHVALSDLGPPIKVAWHSSCHAMREMGVADEPARLLAQLSGVEVVGLRRPGECCGFGGTFAVKEPDVSAAMVADKVADVEATGAEVLLSGDCGCLMNITGALEAKASPVKGMHIAEFLRGRCHARSRP